MKEPEKLTPRQRLEAWAKTRNKEQKKLNENKKTNYFHHQKGHIKI